MKKSDQASVTVKPLLQKVFTALILAAFLAQNAQILYYLIQQLPYNDNLSGFLLIGVNAFLLPLAYFSFGYWASASSAKGKWGNWFSAALLMSIGTTLSSLVSLASMWAYSNWITIGGSYWESVMYNLGAGAVTLAIFVWLVLWLKRKGHLA